MDQCLAECGRKIRACTSLSYTATGYDNSANLSGPGNGAMAYSGNGPGVSTATRSFTTSSGVVWFSALISIDETWDRAILWIDSVGGSFGDDFVGVLDGNIQMRYNATNLTTAGAPTTGTHLLLAKAEIDVSGSNDRLTSGSIPTSRAARPDWGQRPIPTPRPTRSAPRSTGSACCWSIVTLMEAFIPLTRTTRWRTAS